MLKKVLITGVNGYIGTVLAEKVKKKGYKVVGWDNDYFKKITLGPYKNKYSSKKIDIRQKQIDLSKIDCIIHLAALSNDPMGALNEKLTYDINFKASLQLAKEAKRVGVKRFIFSSSCAVYGIAKSDIVNEKSKINPLTAYAKSKALAEEKLKKLADKDFCVCILRNATVYGYSPRFRNDLVVNNLVTSGLVLGEIRVLSDGTPWRPLIDVRDLSDIFCRFIEIEIKKVNGEIFNIGFSNSNYQVKDIIEVIKKYLPECKIKYTGEHGKDTRSYRVDFNKLSKLFPDVKQKWVLDRSVRDLIKKLKISKFGRVDFEKERYARLAILNSLINKGRVRKDLFWRNS